MSFFCSPKSKKDSFAVFDRRERLEQMKPHASTSSLPEATITWASFFFFFAFFLDLDFFFPQLLSIRRLSQDRRRSTHCASAWTEKRLEISKLLCKQLCENLFSPDIFLTLFARTDPAEWFTHRIHTAAKGLGTNDTMLLQCLLLPNQWQVGRERGPR